MPVLRDVLATFSVLVDDKPLTKLDRRIDKLKERVRTFSAYGATAFGAAAYGAFQLTERASDAEEALNVLQATFKQNSDAVVNWSKVTGKAMQRSEYSLQKAAGDFGKFLRPTLEGTNADIMLMSENLTKLGVDLASFHNTSDEEAMMRLFSGLSGETEAVRRLGINISDEALTALNKSRGDSRSVTQLSLAEKTMLRYEKILMDSTDAQGDAVRSANRWAGQLKELKERLKTIGIEMGKRLMPVMLGLLRRVQPLIDKLLGVWDALENKTSTLRAAFVHLGTAVTAYGIMKIIELTKANWSLIESLAHSTYEIYKQRGGWQALAGTVGKVALQFLAIEDIVTFFRGGRSEIGDFISALTGASDPLDAVAQGLRLIVAYVRDAIAYVWDLGRKAVLVAKAVGQAATGNTSGAKKTLESAGKSGYESEVDKIKGEVKTRSDASAQALASGDQETFIASRPVGMSALEANKLFWKQRKAAVEAYQQNRAGSPGTGGNKITLNQSDYDSGFISQDFADAMGAKGGAVRSAPAPAAAAPVPTKIIHQGNVTITVDSNATAERIKQLIEEAQQEQLRAADAADGEESD